MLFSRSFGVFILTYLVHTSFVLKAQTQDHTVQSCEECEFPFDFNGRTYHKCTYRSTHIITNNTKKDFSRSWCVTNKTAFNAESTKTKNGWKYCKEECLKKVCDECEKPYTYKGYQFTDCTWHGRSRPWCVTNATEFSDRDGRGWELSLIHI